MDTVNKVAVCIYILRSKHNPEEIGEIAMAWLQFNQVWHMDTAYKSYHYIIGKEKNGQNIPDEVEVGVFASNIMLLVLRMALEKVASIDEVCLVSDAAGHRDLAVLHDRFAGKKFANILDIGRAYQAVQNTDYSPTLGDLGRLWGGVGTLSARDMAVGGLKEFARMARKAEMLRLAGADIR
jgi:hypothetical protein